MKKEQRREQREEEQSEASKRREDDEQISTTPVRVRSARHNSILKIEIVGSVGQGEGVCIWGRSGV